MGGYFDVVSYLMGRRALYGKMLDLYPTDTIENAAVASFPDGADGVPIKELKIAITPVQAAGTPTPENPLPISGWTGANITVESVEGAGDGAVYAVSWQSVAGTVYGGTLTDNGDGTWTLTVTQILASVTWGDGTNPQVGESYERRTFDNAFSSVVQTNATNCPNNIGIAYATSGDYARYYIATTNMKRVQLYLPNGTSNDLVVQIVGNLATPVSYPITADSVKTLLGDNNIFADCGNILKLVYRADVGKYIEKKLAEGTE